MLGSGVVLCTINTLLFLRNRYLGFDANATDGKKDLTVIRIKVFQVFWQCFFISILFSMTYFVLPFYGLITVNFRDFYAPELSILTTLFYLFLTFVFIVLGKELFLTTILKNTFRDNFFPRIIYRGILSFIYVLFALNFLQFRTYDFGFWFLIFSIMMHEFASSVFFRYYENIWISGFYNFCGYFLLLYVINDSYHPFATVFEYTISSYIFYYITLAWQFLITVFLLWMFWRLMKKRGF